MYKWYLIYACEQKYAGYHGIFNVDLIECPSFKDAQEIGAEMSIEVMESYNTLKGYITDDMNEVDVEEFYIDNISYCIWEVDMSKIDNLSFKELRAKVYPEWKKFRNKYCYKESADE